VEVNGRRMVRISVFPLALRGAEERQISVFVFKYRRTSRDPKRTTAESFKAEPEEVDVQRVFPIYGHFGIVMSQTRRTTLATSTTDILEQPRSSEYYSNSAIPINTGIADEIC
jgi:hypothetical protein